MSSLSASPPVPHERSYWVLPGRFLAGCFPGDLDQAMAARKRDALLAAGVTDFVSLMEADETDHSGHRFAGYEEAVERAARTAGREVAFHRFPIADGAVPSQALMGAIIAVLDALLAAGRTPYLHCWGGRGRTGTVVACWLCHREKITGREALEHLQRLTAARHDHFHPTPETSVQRAFVKSWEVGR